MKCVICNHADTVAGTTSILLERDQLTLVVKNVPAQICPNCSEAYTDETVTASLLREAEKMAKAGTRVDVREYAFAAD
jgi:YgiT-type zinc finger domain-containing protein